MIDINFHTATHVTVRKFETFATLHFENAEGTVDLFFQRGSLEQLQQAAEILKHCVLANKHEHERFTVADKVSVL